MTKTKKRKGCHDKDREKKNFSPHRDGPSVVVPPLAIPAPVVAHQVHVQHVGGHLGLASLQLLHRSFAHEERGCACSAEGAD